MVGSSKSGASSSSSTAICWLDSSLVFFARATRAGCLPGFEIVNTPGLLLDIRMKRSCCTNGASFWSHLRNSSTFKGCVKSITSGESSCHDRARGHENAIGTHPFLFGKHLPPSLSDPLSSAPLRSLVFPFYEQPAPPLTRGQIV